jgi:type I restriction enzyme S subunit
MKTGYRLQSGDLVYSRIDARNGAFAIVPDELNGAVVSKDFPTFAIERERIHPSFLSRFLSTEQFFNQLQASTFGTTNRQRISENLLLSYQIPAPPLSEQERIVTLLEKTDDLRKQRADADQRTAALIPAVFQEMFDELKITHPSRTLGEIVEFGSGATPSKDDPKYWEGSTPWVSPKDMKADEITDAEDHVSTSAFEKTNLHLIPKDTVLIVVRGMILAHTIPIRICRVSVAINQDMKALLPKQPLESEYLRWSLQAQHPKLLNQISTASHGTKKLDSEILKALPIRLPPLPLQKEFSARVSEIRRIQAVQGASRRRLDDLSQSMLHRAFNGEL